VLISSCRKFGKQIQRRQLDLPEYAASFVNYKALKKVGVPAINPGNRLNS
jgi:CDK inhibitor PHO81